MSARLPVVRIYGGGVAGLTAAFELERVGGIRVLVHEKGPAVGGMARSVMTPEGYPTEHSWRGYGPQYHNFYDLMGAAGIENALHEETLAFDLLDSVGTFMDTVSMRDLVVMYSLVGYVFLTGKRTATTRAQPILRKFMTKDGAKAMEAFLAGPGYGLDISTASLKHLFWLTGLKALLMAALTYRI